MVVFEFACGLPEGTHMNALRIMSTTVVAAALSLLIPLAQAVDMSKFIKTEESPGCGLLTIMQWIVAVCEFDSAKRNTYQCNEQRPVYNVPKWKACAYIGNG